MMLYFHHKIFVLLALLVLLLSGCASTDRTPLIKPGISRGNIQAASDALKLQGQPYLYGGQSPQEGFDCSGLVVYVYDQQGVKLPRTTGLLAQQLPDVNPNLRQPGDLLFFNTERPFSHVGIYVGNDSFVHAPSARSGQVMKSSLRQPYWQERFMAVRRPVQNRVYSDSRN